MRRAMRGVAAVEFALVLPLLLVLLLGIIDWGWYFLVETTASAASREGARTAITYPGDCPNGEAVAAAQTVATSRMAGLGYAANTTVTTTCATLVSGDPEFRVQVQVLFPQLTGFPLIPMPRQGDALRAFAETTMRGVQ